MRPPSTGTPFRTLPVLALMFALGAQVDADDPPAPDFERVHRLPPESCLDLPESLGTRARIEKTAAQIPDGASIQDRLVAIHGWIEASLRYDPDAAYVWRDADRLLADGTYGGCADHAVLFGALARAKGIPTVWVKSMDADWIREFLARGETGSWRGHVFLEVHDGSRWLLLDATQGVLYPDYDRRMRHLPGGRWAYDKGGDPFALVLSPRWELWKEQTRRHFRGFDVALLPPGGGTKLYPPDTVFIAADSPAWQWVADRCRALGRPHGFSGNSGFEQWLPCARARSLVVVAVAGRTVLPEAERARLFPMGLETLLASASGEGVVETHRLDDGTWVVLVAGPDEPALARLIAGLEIPNPAQR